MRTKTLGRKEPAQMMIIWGGFHPSWQQVSWLDTETGEAGAQKLVHAAGEAQGFIGIAMEATGNSQWFVEMDAGSGARDLDRGCGPDPGQLRGQTED